MRSAYRYIYIIYIYQALLWYPFDPFVGALIEPTKIRSEAPVCAYSTRSTRKHWIQRQSNNGSTGNQWKHEKWWAVELTESTGLALLQVISLPGMSPWLDCPPSTAPKYLIGLCGVWSTSIGSWHTTRRLVLFLHVFAFLRFLSLVRYKWRAQAVSFIPMNSLLYAGMQRVMRPRPSCR